MKIVYTELSLIASVIIMKFFIEVSLSYTYIMDQSENIQDLTGYIPVKEAAEILGISVRRVYGHIEKGHLPAVRFANVLGIPEKALKEFEYGISGRKRKNTPVWHKAAAKSVWLQIFVQMRPGLLKEFEQHLEKIRLSGTHIFPGTAARYVSLSDQRANEVQIQLVWRGSMIPELETREDSLEELRRELADVLDWQTARYETGQVLMHT